MSVVVFQKAVKKINQSLKLCMLTSEQEVCCL